MKRRTERTIHAEFELQGRDPYWEALRQRYPRGTGGFAQFMALLESCTRGIPADGGPPCPKGVSAEARAKLRHAKLTIIGHSMGAIVVNQLVQAFPDLNYESIVYLSGAATVRDTKAALEPVLRQHGGRTTFYNLMLHPLNEALETHFAGSIPSGSLLVWVDEMLEHPDTRLDRTVGQWSNMQGGRHAFAPDVRHGCASRSSTSPRTSTCSAIGQTRRRRTTTASSSASTAATISKVCRFGTRHSGPPRRDAWCARVRTTVWARPLPARRDEALRT